MVEAVSQAKNQDIDAHLVLTVYDSKDWMGDFLEPAVEIEKSGNPGVFYTDPEKAEKYSALSLGKKGTVLSGFTKHTIQDIGINVKSQSETLQFKSWFGDSKVVDESGKPLVVYHGTNWDGWEFDTENGAFFSEKEDYAEEMAAQRGGSRTVKAYLSIKNPLVVKVPGNKMADPEFEARIIAEAKSKGHDGVKLETDTNNEIEKDVFWVAFEPNQIKSASDNVGTFDPGNPDVRFSVAPDEELELDRVNQAFNSELQKQINGELPKGYLYQLGRPGSILRSTGIPDLPIEMSATRLAEKANTEHHLFDIEDVKDLPLYLNKPIGVFEYGNKDKAQNIVVEIQKEDKHFIVGLSLNFKHDGLVVNSIKGLYPKDTHEWLTWIQNNKALYLNKEKVQALIAQQRRNPADVNYLDLDLISKIVRDFQNASVNEENSSRNSVSPESDAELELVQGNSNSESGMRDAKLEQTDIRKVQKLDHSQYQENTMLAETAEIPVVHVESKFKTLNETQEIIEDKIRKNNGSLKVMNTEQNMQISIQSNGSLDEAVSLKALDSTRTDGTMPEIHAAALLNIEKLLETARLGASHPDWHVHAKNFMRGEKKEKALQIHRFYAAMEYEKNIYGVKMTVREKRNGKTVFYTLEAHDLEIQKINPAVENNRGGVVKAASPGRSPGIQFSMFFEKFKPIVDLLGLKYKEDYPFVRFSVAPDDAFVQAWAKVLLPVVSTQYINVDGAAAYLMDHGIEVYAGRDDDTLRKACVLAQTWKKNVSRRPAIFPWVMCPCRRKRRRWQKPGNVLSRNGQRKVSRPYIQKRFCL